MFITPLMIPVPRIPIISEPWDLLISELYRYMQPPKTRRQKKNRTLRMYTSLSRSCVATWMPCFRRWKISTPFGYLDQGWYPSFLEGYLGILAFLGSLTWASNPQMKRNDFYNTFSGSEGETKMQCIIFRIWCPCSIFPLKHGYWRRVSIRTPLHKHRRKRRKNIMFKVGIFLQSGCGDPLWLRVLQFRSIVSLPFGHFFNGDQK